MGDAFLYRLRTIVEPLVWSDGTVRHHSAVYALLEEWAAAGYPGSEEASDRRPCAWCGQVVEHDAEGRAVSHPFPADSGLDGECNGSGMTEEQCGPEDYSNA